MIRAAHLVAACLALSGCGLRPLYSGGTNGAVAASLRSVDVAPIEGQIGWLVRNNLTQRLSAAGEGDAVYRLEVELDDNITGFGIRGDRAVTRAGRPARLPASKPAAPGAAGRRSRQGRRGAAAGPTRRPQHDALQALLVLGAYGKGGAEYEFQLHHAASQILSGAVPRARLQESPSGYGRKRRRHRSPRAGRTGTGRCGRRGGRLGPAARPRAGPRRRLRRGADASRAYGAQVHGRGTRCADPGPSGSACAASKRTCGVSPGRAATAR